MKTRLLAIVLAWWACQVTPQWSMAQAPVAVAAKETEIVETATSVLDEIMSIPARGIPEWLLADAEGIAVLPNLIKGGFVVGVKHGRGVLVMRDANQQWQPPAFITMTGGSLGWQIGVQATDLVLVFKTPASIRGLMSGKLTLGANASVAAGPVGRLASADTDARLKAEIYSYSRSRGLFAGVALDGSVLQVDSGANWSFYGAAQPPTIAPGQTITLPAKAVRLLERLSAYTITPAVEGTQLVASGPVAPNPSLRPHGLELASVQAKLLEADTRLSSLLDDNWKRYLALPAGLKVPGGKEPTMEDISAVARRYEVIAQSPQYSVLAERAEFREVQGLLRRYAELRTLASTTPSPTVALPPPPEGGRR